MTASSSCHNNNTLSTRRAAQRQRGRRSQMNSLTTGQWLHPLLGFVLIGAAALPAAAQEKYPSRPIEFIVPWGPGGGADQLARKLAPGLEKELKVSLPVINVAGATGQTGLNKMLTQPNDGYSVSVFIAD